MNKNLEKLCETKNIKYLNFIDNISKLYLLRYCFYYIGQLSNSIYYKQINLDEQDKN